MVQNWRMRKKKIGARKDGKWDKEDDGESKQTEDNNPRNSCIQTLSFSENLAYVITTHWSLELTASIDDPFLVPALTNANFPEVSSAL
jgi:hypothetical protein